MSTGVLGPLVLLVCLVVVGAAAFGLVWGVAAVLFSTVRDALLSLAWHRREHREHDEPLVSDAVNPPVLTETSTDALWQQMQGTAGSRPVRRRARETRASTPRRSV